MILADASVWIDHLNSEEPEMGRLLNSDEIVMHPFVAGEIALGSLRNRPELLARLDSLPEVSVAYDGEVRRMIEDLNLYSRGIGWTDAHLIAAVLINPPIQLWTRDKALRGIAEALALHVTWR